jgi:hypothetical protein
MFFKDTAMRFEVVFTSVSTSIRAICEHTRDQLGWRGQYPHVPLRLRHNPSELVLEYAPQIRPHPDVLGLICITAFYPFIRYTATLPEPVSPQFATAMSDVLKQREMVKGTYTVTHPIVITNVDPTVKPVYSPKVSTADDKTSGAAVIAYGGGMDSTAVAILFPDLPLIHTIEKQHSQRSAYIHPLVSTRLVNSAILVTSNDRDLVTPTGVTTWTSIFLVPLLMLAEFDATTILHGSVLASTFLSNGIQYFPADVPHRQNPWMRAYRHVGIDIFSPVGGCSEFITTRIVYHTLRTAIHDVLYCQERNGLPCHACFKCFRKNLLIEYCITCKNTAAQRPREYWQRYAQVATRLNCWPLYSGHVLMACCRKLLLRGIPLDMLIPRVFLKRIMRDRTTNIFVKKAYPNGLHLVPSAWKKIVQTCIDKYAKTMTPREAALVQAWDQTRDGLMAILS